VKTYAVLGLPTASRKPVRKSRLGMLGEAQRECIALSDPTDCLLEAYDCIARRAYEHFLARGPRLGGEVEDWLSAENEVLLDLAITVEDAVEFVYALTSVPGATAARLEVGIETRWLVILAQTLRPALVRRTEIVSDAKSILGLGPAIRRGQAQGLSRSGVDAHLEVVRQAGLDVNGGTEPRMGARPGIASGVEGICLRSKSACVVELPADVDAERSIAVLSNGLLAIRMPKTNSRQ
jgi:Protein of unknown function (DUF2934)